MHITSDDFTLKVDHDIVKIDGSSVSKPKRKR